MIYFLVEFHIQITNSKKKTSSQLQILVKKTLVQQSIDVVAVKKPGPLVVSAAVAIVHPHHPKLVVVLACKGNIMIIIGLAACAGFLLVGADLFELVDELFGLVPLFVGDSVLVRPVPLFQHGNDLLKRRAVPDACLVPFHRQNDVDQAVDLEHEAFVPTGSRYDRYELLLLLHCVLICSLCLRKGCGWLFFVRDLHQCVCVSARDGGVYVPWSFEFSVVCFGVVDSNVSFYSSINDIAVATF